MAEITIPRWRVQTFVLRRRRGILQKVTKETKMTKIDQQWVLEKVRKYGVMKIADDVMEKVFPGTSATQKAIANACRLEYASIGARLPTVLEPKSPVDRLKEFCHTYGFTWDDDWLHGCFVIRDPKWTALTTDDADGN